MNTDRSRALPSFVAAGLVAASLTAGSFASPAAAAPTTPTDKAACTIVGTPGPDVLRGGPRDDVICGRGGDDLLIGGAGDDELRGGPGDDELRGGSGSDLLRGGRGDDRLVGDGGGDRLRGHAGADRLDGGPGDDRLSGGRGADVLQGGPGTDVLDGGPGADQVDAQDPPTAIVLSGGEVSENQPVGTEVGRLTAVDADAGDTHTFALVAGAGDAGNGAFAVAGDRLLTSRPLDFEATPRLTLRVQATDSTGLRFATTVEVTVRDVAENGAPVAADDTATLDEDAPATDVDVLANDTDPDRDRLTVSGVEEVTGGTATVSDGRVRFTPAADRCGAGAGGLRYTVSDGRDATASARVRVDVRCLPDPTVAHDDAVTVDEDAAATTVDVLANDTDPDDEPPVVASVTQPAHGEALLSGGTVRYEPDADFCGTDSFTYTVAGGGTATVAVTVTCVDDAPVAVDDTVDVTEDDAATAMPVGANDTDIDAGPKNVVATTEAGHGEVGLADGVVTYEADADYCGSDSFDYTLNGGSEATVTVAVACVDDAPVAVADAVTVSEDASRTTLDVLSNDTDVDGGTREVTAVHTSPAHGVAGLGDGLDYRPAANFCGTDSLVYEITGGSRATVTITVTCVDDAPVARDDTVTTLTGTRVNVDLLANDTDIDAGPMTAQLVTGPSWGALALRNDGTGSYTPTRDSCGSDPVSHTDSFTYRLLPGGSTATVEITVTCVDDPPVAVADDVTVDEDSGATEVDLLGNDTDVDGGPKDVSGVTDAEHGEVVLADGVVTYEPEADFCGTDTFTYDLSPGDTSATVTVTVDCVDDAPVAVDDTATVLEDAVDASIDVLTNETDIDAGPRRLGATLAAEPAHGTVDIAQDGSGLSYTPDANHCGQDAFGYRLAGGSTATVEVTITCVNDAPTVPDVTLSGADAAIGNTTLIVEATDDAYGPVTGPAKVITHALLATADDVDGPGSLTVKAERVPTTGGGYVDIWSDGTFRYQPSGASGCVGTDSFSYRVSDEAVPPSTTTGTVQIARTGCVWYVDNTAAANGDGTSVAPFDTLAEVWSPSRTTDTVFVYAGDGTSTGYDAGVVLRNDQRLLGEVSGLRMGSTDLIAPAPGKRPLLTATNASVVSLANGNVVSGLRIDPAGGSGVRAGSVTNGTLSDLQIIDTGAPAAGAALALIGTQGTVNVSDLQVDTGAATNPPSSAVGVQIQNSDTVTFAPSSTVRITTKGAKALSVSDTALGTSQIDQVTVTGSFSGAVDLARATGTVTFGALDLTTTGGTAAAFSVVSSGSVTVSASGTADVHATGGPAVDVTGTAGAVLAFDDVDSTNSATDGVNLANLGTGSFTAASGSTISGAAGIAFDLDGGSGAVTWAGQVLDGTGATAEVTNRTGGAVTFSGAVTDGVDNGGGISLSGNTGGSTTFSSGLTLRTTNSAGVVMTGSAGHSLALTGGNLMVTTDNGAGVRATGSGSLAVTGSNNEISTTSGIALEVSDTKIASAGLVFKRISADQTPVGILLDRTGTTASDGSLTITGISNGTVCGNGTIVGCSGGTISNGSGGDSTSATPTGTGIVLNQTRAPSLARLRIFGHSNYGIRGTAVAGFVLTDSIVLGGAGNAAAPYHDSAISFTDLTGSASFTRVYVDGGASDDLRILNGSGSLDRLTVDTVTFGVAGSNPTNDAMLVESTGSATVKMTVKNSTFSSAAGDLLQVDHNGSGAADVVLDGNTFRNQNPAITDGGGGVSLSQGGTSGATTMRISGNTFSGAVGHAVKIVKARGASTQVGTFSANQVGVAASTLSGSVAGDGLRIQSLGQGASTWLVSDNTIRQYGGHGISVLAGGSGVATGGAVDATVRGNSVAEFNDVTTYGIQLQLGSVAGDSFLGCAAITGNTVAAGGGAYDISVRQRFATTLRLPGYTGAVADTSAASAYVNAGNGNNNQVEAVVSGPPTGGGITGGTCAEPPA